MLMNNLDPDVAEDPDHLVVYGGTGRAARSWEAFDAIVAELQRLADDETLLIQSGKPVGVFRTTPDAPRVLIANANLVPHWATWEQFRELERAGLTMYGQMTAGSWIYIATQGIIQGTYETFGEAARQHFGGTLARDGDDHRRARRDGRRAAAGHHHERGGRAGRGGRRVARASAAGGRLRRRADGRPRRGDRARRPMAHRAGAADRWPWSGTRPTSCRSSSAAAGTPTWSPTRPRAHDPLGGYVPNGMSLADALALRTSDPDAYVRRSTAAMAEHVRAMLAFQAGGAVTFDYGNNIRQVALEAGVENAFDFPGFVPAFIRPLFCEGKGPFRVAALSGDPDDIAVIDRALAELFPDDDGPPALAAPGGRADPGPGPARADLLAGLRRSGAGRAADQRARRIRASSAHRSSSAATTSTRAPSPARTARPRPCATAPTPSPTGRSSTRW